MFLLFQYFEEIVPFATRVFALASQPVILCPLTLYPATAGDANLLFHLFHSLFPRTQAGFLDKVVCTFSSRTYCICCSQFVFYTEETKRRTCICSAKYLHSVCMGNWASSFLLLQSSIQFWSLTSASWTVILKRNISLINRTSSSILASWILLNNIEFSNLPCSFNLTIRTDLFYQLFTWLWLFFPPVFA